ncbi:MAG: hypothetical protein FGM14_09630 [Flavobacteriales bacterium]|nr:hypothetical protein [Flavobacteriales bacterium]
MKRITFLLIGFLILFSSCEKFRNNRAEVKLEGKWELVKSEYGGEEVDLTGRTQTLTFYDSNDKEYAGLTANYGVMENSYDGFTYTSNFEYFVTEKGTTLNLYLEFNSPQNASTFQLSNPDLNFKGRNKFIMSAKNPDGLESKFTFNRIK